MFLKLKKAEPGSAPLFGCVSKKFTILAFYVFATVTDETEQAATQQKKG